MISTAVTKKYTQIYMHKVTTISEFTYRIGSPGPYREIPDFMQFRWEYTFFPDSDISLLKFYATMTVNIFLFFKIHLSHRQL